MTLDGGGKRGRHRAAARARRKDQNRPTHKFLTRPSECGIDCRGSRLLRAFTRAPASRTFPRFTPDFARLPRRTSSALHSGLQAPFTPDFKRPSLRTSSAFHSGLQAPFTPDFKRPSLRTSSAFHSDLQAPFTPSPRAAVSVLRRRRVRRRASRARLAAVASRAGRGSSRSDRASPAGAGASPRRRRRPPAACDRARAARRAAARALRRSARCCRSGDRRSCRGTSAAGCGGRCRSACRLRELAQTPLRSSVRNCDRRVGDGAVERDLLDHPIEPRGLQQAAHDRVLRRAHAIDDARRPGCGAGSPAGS